MDTAVVSTLAHLHRPHAPVALLTASSREREAVVEQLTAKAEHLDTPFNHVHNALAHLLVHTQLADLTVDYRPGLFGEGDVPLLVKTWVVDQPASGYAYELAGISVRAVARANRNGPADLWLGASELTTFFNEVVAKYSADLDHENVVKMIQPVELLVAHLSQAGGVLHRVTIDKSLYLFVFDFKGETRHYDVEVCLRVR